VSESFLTPRICSFGPGLTVKCYTTLGNANVPTGEKPDLRTNPVTGRGNSAGENRWKGKGRKLCDVTLVGGKTPLIDVKPPMEETTRKEERTKEVMSWRTYCSFRKAELVAGSEGGMLAWGKTLGEWCPRSRY